jgi:hypothetical protein
VLASLTPDERAEATAALGLPTVHADQKEREGER